MKQNRIIFITGTDTGAGKTLLTALLLQRLRETGIHALAMKPFCSGGRGDVRLLQALQRGELSDAEMNPFYFAKPVAPLAAAGRGRGIHLAEVVKRIRRIAEKCEYLLVEGSGGLMVPLGKGFLVSDLIAALDCEVVVAARNRLGVINHTLLTVEMLRRIGVPSRKMLVVLMGVERRDASAASNYRLLSGLLGEIRIKNVQYSGGNASTPGSIRREAGKLEWLGEMLA